MSTEEMGLQLFSAQSKLLETRLTLLNVITVSSIVIFTLIIFTCGVFRKSWLTLEIGIAIVFLLLGIGFLVIGILMN